HYYTYLDRVVFEGYPPHQNLHSFPTRRSSDLKNGDVDEFITYYLADLAKNLSGLIVVCNGKLSDQGRKAFEQFTDQILVRENKGDRKSTRLNSSHVSISYAVFCLKKKKKDNNN